MIWKTLSTIHWLRGPLRFTVPSTGCTVVNTMINSVEYWCYIDIFYVMCTQCYESSDKNAMESVAMTRVHVSMTSYTYG